MLAGVSFAPIRLHLVAPWRARRDAAYRPLDWVSHGWVGLWAAAAMLLIWMPAGPWMAGAVVGLLSGAPPLARALRQLGIGYGAALVTYLLGLLFGVGVA